MARSTRVVAWMLEWAKWPGITSIVASASRGKAITAVLRQIREAGYKPSFFEMQARRARMFDQWAEAQRPERQGIAFAEERVRLEAAMIQSVSPPSPAVQQSHP